jgi:hypothetical protein
VKAGRLLILAGALVVVGLIVGLFVVTRQTSAPAAPSTPAPGPAAAPPPEAPVAKAPPMAPPPAQPVPPPVPDAGSVRDHRGETPVAPPPRAQSPETVTGVLRALTPGVAGCAANIPVALDGAISILVNITLRTAGGRLHAEGVTVDGTSGLGDAYATCVAQVVGALDLPAPAGAADGADSVHLPFRVP